jgi:tRNA (guanine9-N1)-methyltransferase
MASEPGPEGANRAISNEPPSMASIDDRVTEPSVENNLETENPTNPRRPPETDADGNPLSKNKMRKLKRQIQWEEKKDDRKRRRKEKRTAKQIRKREEREVKAAEAIAAGIDPSTLFKRAPKKVDVLVPISLIIDCDFEEYMADSELVSLSSQITRSYSDNRNAQYQTHLYCSSWRGKLDERFRTVLHGHHTRWHNFHVVQGDFIVASREATERMEGRSGGTMIALIRPTFNNGTEIEQEESDSRPIPNAEPDSSSENSNIVYLSSESPHTLDRLEANTCYIIGGLVDKNREKGLCYKRARAKGIRTAKLPIGQYMVMQSRQVLATNHVVEIMLRWLECGDWGEAFLKVIPKRKGGRLRDDSSVADSSRLDDQEHDEAGDYDEYEEEQEEEGATDNVIENSAAAVAKELGAENKP